MNTEPIDGARALTLLREVVAEHPGMVYVPPKDDIALYSYGGAPSCIVGHALARAGWSAAELSELDAGNVGAAEFTCLVTSVINRDAAEVLAAAQEWQDDPRHGDWDGALNAAAEYFAAEVQ